MIDQVNLDSKVPLHTQVSNLLMYAIASGQLMEGDKLPTITDTAQAVNNNHNTVQYARRGLQMMGLVEFKRGRGHYVRTGAKAKCRLECRKRLIEKLFDVIAEANASGMTHARIEGVVKQCYEVADGPYDDAPKTLLAMAKVNS